MIAKHSPCADYYTINNVTYKLSLLPSGVVRPGKLSIIGNGVVVDPWALLSEIAAIAKQGVQITPDSLMLADNAALILPVHRILDAALEEAKGTNKIGTTGRGIGPAYEDKVGRRAIRVCDLADRASLEMRLDQLLFHHNALLRGLGAEEIQRAPLLDSLLEVTPKIMPYVGRVWARLDAERRKGRRIRLRPSVMVIDDVAYTTMD